MSFLFRPIDIASLCFFRVIFGLLGLIEVINVYVYQHWIVKGFQLDKFRFKYYGFEWVEPLPEPFLSLAFLIIALAAVGVILGWRYRISASIFAVGFTYTFLLEKAFYLNHGYLFCLLSFLMICLPAHRNYSLDAWRQKVERVATIPFWPIFLLCFMMSVVYCYGGIAKINSDWLQGLPLKLWLKGKSGYPIIGGLLKQEWVAYFMSYGGLLLDLTVVFFLLHRLTRIWAFVFVLFFHFINLFIFQIGIFPWLSTALTALFFPPDFPRHLFQWWSAKIKNVHSIVQRWNTAWKTVPESHIYTSNLSKKQISNLIVIFCLAQLLIPLRQHLFEGNTAWTEKGHRYSWRMVLRGKTGNGDFTIVEPHSGRSEKVKPEKFLYKRQERKLYGQPDMILQFAHFLRDEYAANGWRNPEVYAHIKIKLNARPYQQFVNPEYNLADQKWNPFRLEKWILPETVAKGEL